MALKVPVSLPFYGFRELLFAGDSEGVSGLGRHSGQHRPDGHPGHLPQWEVEMTRMSVPLSLDLS